MMMAGSDVSVAEIIPGWGEVMPRLSWYKSSTTEEIILQG